jgi:hypothetical protein
LIAALSDQASFADKEDYAPNKSSAQYLFVRFSSDERKGMQPLLPDTALLALIQQLSHLSD